MLPPLAAVDDLEEWSSISITNLVRAQAILAAASTLVRSSTGRAWVGADGEWEDGVTDLQQDQVKTVVVTVADRVYKNPDGTSQDVAGPFSHMVSAWFAHGLALTEDELAMLPSGSSGIPGLSSIRVVAPALARGSHLFDTCWWEDWDPDAVPTS